MGIFVPVSAKPKLCIVTEAEAGGMRASQLFKLAEGGGDTAPLMDALPPEVDTTTTTTITITITTTTRNNINFTRGLYYEMHTMLIKMI
jgi:hypothetical protein